MKTRKYKQFGGSYLRYTRAEKRKLRDIGFTNKQIQLLNHIKQTYGFENLNADGIVYLINENADEQLNPTSYTAWYKTKYIDDAYTDNEYDTDDEIYGGRKKRKSRKRRSRYLTKRETRRQHNIHRKIHKHIHRK